MGLFSCRNETWNKSIKVFLSATSPCTYFSLRDHLLFFDFALLTETLWHKSTPWEFSAAIARGDINSRRRPFPPGNLGASSSSLQPMSRKEICKDGRIPPLSDPLVCYPSDRRLLWSFSLAVMSEQAWCFFDPSRGAGGWGPELAISRRVMDDNGWFVTGLTGDSLVFHFPDLHQ